MRRREGIDDVELREAIRGLRAGDCVHVTLKTDAQAFHGETVLVRITSVRARDFLGKLAHDPASAVLAHLRAGARVAFTAAHVHSLPRGGTGCEQR